MSNTNEMATGSTTETFTATNWEPGDTLSDSLYISNSGTIDLTTLTLAFTYTLDTTQRPTGIDLNNPLEDTDDFGKMISVTAATWKGYDLDEALTDQIVGLTLDELNQNSITLSTVEALQGGEKGELHMEFLFDTDATNGCQGNILNLTLTVLASQQSGH